MATKTIAWGEGDGSITLTYDGSGNGAITVTSSDNNLFTARSKTITVQTVDGSVSRTVTINQAARSVIDLSTAVVTAANQTYSGSALTPTPTVALNGETVPSTGYDVTYSNNTNAGTATVIVTGKGDYTGTASGNFTINKAAPTYTAPTAKSLTYNRGSQALLNAGSTSHGTIQYSSNGSSWSTTIPSQTNANTYTVYWRLVGDANHTDVSSTSINVTIAKVTPVVATSPSTRTGLTYTGSNQNLLSGGSMKHSSSDTTAVAGTFTYAQGKNAGTYNSLTWSFAPTDSTNYNSTSGTVSGSVSIAKANPVYTAPTANNRTYNTSSAALLNAGSSTTAGSFTYCATQGGTYSSTIPSQTNAGTYTTYYKFTPTDTTNYNSIGATAVSTTISAKTVSSPTITLSQSTYTYSGSACTPTATVKDGSTTISSSEYTVSYSNNTNAGTATVTITDKSGGNYTVSGSTTFTINKANPTYTAPTAASNLSYTGSAQYLTTTGSTSHGTIYYSSDNSIWYTTRRTGTTAGSYTTYWKLTGDSNHSDISSTSISTSIAKASRTISFSDVYNVVAPSGTITKTATPSAGSGDGAVTYSISSTTYATINSSTGKVTAKTSEGSATVTATVAEGTNYQSASATYTLYVFSTTHNFDYTGSVQSLLLPPGSYKLETWGAQGGSNAAASSYSITAQSGGKGGYSTGQLTLPSAQTVYAFVGGQGGSSGNGGWNGGGGGSGSSSYDSSNTNGVSRMGCGGGATDIALTTSTMSYSSYRTNRSSESLLSRMIVAGGGSGGAMCYKAVTTETTTWESQTVTQKRQWTYRTTKITEMQCAGSNFTLSAGDYIRLKVTCNDSTVTYIQAVYNSSDGEKQLELTSGTYGYLTIPSGCTWIIFQIQATGASSYVPYSSITATIGKQVSSSSTSTSTSSQVGYVGGGSTGGGYSSTYQGKQTSAGTDGGFGYGANQTSTNYRYASACGGGGWYGGGGGDKSDTDMSYAGHHGGGSGFVNTSASAGNRPSGYTGLQLDSGTTYDGSQSFPNTAGTGNETGHVGNGYAKITRQ